MYIKTREFKITEKELCWILTKKYLLNRRSTILFFAVMGFLGLIFDSHSGLAPFLNYCLFVFILHLVFFPLIIKMQCRNKFNYKNKYFEIDSDLIIAYYQDGISMEFKFTNFTKAIKIFNSYFLYLAPGVFHYLPLAAFYSENDPNKFESLLKDKQLLQAK